MGNWAAENIPAMSDKQLGELEVIIAQENPSLLNWLLGHEDVPEYGKMLVYELRFTRVGYGQG
eukprot:1395165-Amorphochlora_amoeboformis.AAC.1